MSELPLVAVIAAAGIGKRVGASIPKQYLPLLNKTIIEHSIQPFLDHQDIKQVIVSIAENDQWFRALPIAKDPKVKVVIGGAERVDSVLSALNAVMQESYVLVHDAARPCITLADINKLISVVINKQQGAILAMRVRDTMKRGQASNSIEHTVDRDNLWHALTPQMFNSEQLMTAINSNSTPHLITDEASALEMAGKTVNLIEGDSKNIKVTQADDLLLAEFYLTQVKN